jgi:cytochrome oxidase Cu insertion factor (SCO1/SenC/PrrC family)
VHEALRNRDTEFDIVVISVDPKRDSVERVYEYSKRWSMLDEWDFLTGEEQLLLPVWKAYYVSEPEEIDYGEEELLKGDIAEPEKNGVEMLRDKIAEQYSVSHSSPVYVIDSEGYLRMVFTLPFDPDDLIKYVESIMDSG